ncbi:MAG: succinate dehydrogenase cytochrome b subunit [Deltaproteobacteria bacterium]|nr:succinate dehydrogenase cytochrome b subunit [Deltaproteobacteria bacterium]
MSSVASVGSRARVARVWQAPIGKKAVMALTGVVLFGFVLGHMLGNLQIYLGSEQIDHYAVLLRSSPKLLWAVRGVLLVALVLHFVSAAQLKSISRAARPDDYRKYDPQRSTLGARTMLGSGLLLLAFVVYHLMHFTFGNAHPDFEELKVHHNVVTGFQEWPVSVSYIVAMVFLGMHLRHGLWSMFQSLGVSHPRYTPALRTFATVFAVVIVIGNVSIPIAVLAGLIG